MEQEEVKRLAIAAVKSYLRDVMAEGPADIASFTDDIIRSKKLTLEMSDISRIDNYAIAYIKKIFRGIQIL